MISRDLLRACVAAVSLSAATTYSADAPTLGAGALSEGQTQSMVIGGIPLMVYEGAATPLANASILTAPTGEYYYLLPLAFTKAGDRAAHVLKLGPNHYLSFTLRMPTIDTKAVEAELRRRGRLAARAERVRPLTYQALEVSLAPVFTGRMVQQGAGMRGLDEPTQVLWEMEAEMANEVANAINAGALVPTIVADVVISLRQENQTQVSWSRITGSQLFQDYAGPSGPQYVTGAQVAELAANLMDSLKVIQWREFDESSADLTFLMDRLRSPTPIEVDISSKEWSDRLGLEVRDLTKLVDVTTRLATDAKNLDDRAWCQKYDSYAKELNSTATTKDKNTKVVYKVFDGRHRSKGTSTTTSETEDTLSTSDCGRNVIASQFKYEREGTQYVPKSVYLYQNLSASAATKQTASTQSFRITRKLQQLPLTVKNF